MISLMIGLPMMAAQTHDPPATVPPPVPPTAERCQQASETIENRIGVMLRAPVILSAGMKKKDIERLAVIEAIKMKMRPTADAMLAKFPPRPREQQGTPEPIVAGMD